MTDKKQTEKKPKYAGKLIMVTKADHSVDCIDCVLIKMCRVSISKKIEWEKESGYNCCVDTQVKYIFV